jgi:C-terminal processing protease CtpA/Prc
VRVGDVLCKVNEIAITSACKKTQAVSLLRGPSGSKVRLTLEREGQRVSAGV